MENRRGRAAWSSLPGGSSPSGRGFASGDRYFLPLSSAEVVGIDLAAGKIVQTAKSRKGTVPGNLVCFKGNVISQGLEGVDAYYQLDAVSADVERRLAANPNDAEALSLQGEILLDKGKRSEAIASFVRANELAGGPAHAASCSATRFWTACAASSPRYRGQAWRYRAAGGRLRRSARRSFAPWPPACGSRENCRRRSTYYEKLTDIEPEQRPLDEIDKIAAGAARPLAAEPTGRASPRRDAAKRRRRSTRPSRRGSQSAKAARSLEPLQRFVDAFGDQPAAAAERAAELIRRLNAAGRRLEAELATMPAADRGDACNPESPRSPRRNATSIGRSERSKSRPTKVNNNARNNYGRGALNLRGDRDPFFRDLSLQFDYNRRAIFAYDRARAREVAGSLAATDSSSTTPSIRRGTTAAPSAICCWSALGWKIVAIDTLGVGPERQPAGVVDAGLDGPGARLRPTRAFPAAVGAM